MAGRKILGAFATAMLGAKPFDQKLAKPAADAVSAAFKGSTTGPVSAAFKHPHNPSQFHAPTSLHGHGLTGSHISKFFAQHPREIETDAAAEARATQVQTVKTAAVTTTATTMTAAVAVTPKAPPASPAVTTPVVESRTSAPAKKTDHDQTVPVRSTIAQNPHDLNVSLGFLTDFGGDRAKQLNATLIEPTSGLFNALTTSPYDLMTKDTGLFIAGRTDGNFKNNHLVILEGVKPSYRAADGGKGHAYQLGQPVRNPSDRFFHPADGGNCLLLLIPKPEEFYGRGFPWIKAGYESKNTEINPEDRLKHTAVLPVTSKKGDDYAEFIPDTREQKEGRKIIEAAVFLSEMQSFLACRTVVSKFNNEETAFTGTTTGLQKFRNRFKELEAQFGENFSKLDLPSGIRSNPEAMALVSSIKQEMKALGPFPEFMKAWTKGEPAATSSATPANSTIFAPAAAIPAATSAPGKVSLPAGPAPEHM